MNKCQYVIFTLRYDMIGYMYENSRVAVDAVVFTIKNGALMVCLEIREKSPFKGMYQLPGGLLQKSETAEETLERKLNGMFGSKVYFQQFHTFTSPKRDPRERTITIGFMALVNGDKVGDSQTIVPVKKLPEMAFDHKEIIMTAYKILRENPETKIVKEFMPTHFPLNDLQKVHESITEEKLDNRNFRKKMIDGGLVEKSNKIQKNVSHRPALLYKFKRV